MNKNKEIKFHIRKRSILDRLRGVPAVDLPVPGHLRKKDKIKILNEIRFSDYNGVLIKKLQPGDIITYLGRKDNPCSNQNNWLHCEHNGIKGLLLPAGMVDNFEFVEGE